MEFEAGQYDIWARDSEFQRIDQVTDFTSLTLDLKWDDMSTWQLALPTKEYLKRWHLTGIYGSLLTPPGGSGIHGSPLGIIVIRNGSSLSEAILSGIIVKADRKYDGDTDTITLSGECDTSFMRTRDIWPDPSSCYDTTTGWWNSGGSIASDDVSGPCESCISYYTQYNLGEWATEERRLAYFGTSTDQLRGETVQYQGRFQNLFDAALEILHSQQTTPTRQSFEIRQVAETGSTRLLYNWRDPTDKTADSIFGTELGTISSFEYTEALPSANYLLVGGPNYDANATGNIVGIVYDLLGLGTSVYSTGQTTNTAKRMYTDILNETSAQIYGRREGFADYGGNVSGDSSTDAAAKELAIMADMQTQALKSDSESSYAMSATIQLLPFEGPQFMDDWQLGDLVTVNLGAVPGTVSGGNLTFDEIIREVVISVSPKDGERITPTICDSMRFSRSGGSAGKRAYAATKTLGNMGGKLK